MRQDPAAMIARGPTVPRSARLMLEQRDLKKDLLALGLLALAVFLAAALLSYDPGDPPSKLVYPERAEVLNVCGRSGAFVSRYLFSALGLGAYYLVFSLGVLDAMLLARRPLTQPITRLCGWLISLAGLTTFAAMAMPQLSPGPVIGAGGYLGAAGRGLLEMNFATVGAYILTISLVLGGLLLSTDYLLVHIVAFVVGKPAQGIGQGMLQVGAAAAKRLRRKSDLDAYEPDGRRGRRRGQDPRRPRQGAARRREPSRTPRPMRRRRSPRRRPISRPPPRRRSRSPRPPNRPAAAWPRCCGSASRKTPKKDEELQLDEPPQNAADYELPSIELLLPSETFNFDEQENEVRRKAKILEQTFKDFGFNIRVVEIQTGPVIAQFEVELEAGLRLSKITGLADDLAIALRVPSVRIVAPIPGKNTVGIEVPNTTRQIVRLREVIEEANGKAQKMRIPVYLGKDVSGNPMTVDLSTLPHLLIAGRTGTGKSVCLNSIITSMVMTRRPDEVRMLMIDPKMVELSPYKSLPHLMHPVVTDMKKAEAILAWAVEKMEERYHLLARAGVRHLSGYNQLGEEELMERIRPENDEERRQIPTHMPYIVIVADELADLMMTSAKEVETHIIRLAQKSRAVGIHLVLATQKPTVDVITGLIKSNLPARICFQVASRTDSRVVLDEMGADKLLGNGDMLFLWPGTSTLLRGQGTYLSDDEINRVIAAVATTEPQFVKELVQLKAATSEGDEPGRRDEVRRPRRAVRSGHRRRGPRGPRQRIAAATGPGHRLRPRGPADRLHGRGRHRRPVQRLAGPRGDHLAGAMGRDERQRFGEAGVRRAAEAQQHDHACAAGGAAVHRAAGNFGGRHRRGRRRTRRRGFATTRKTKTLTKRTKTKRTTRTTTDDDDEYDQADDDAIGAS